MHSRRRCSVLHPVPLRSISRLFTGNNRICSPDEIAFGIPPPENLCSFFRLKPCHAGGSGFLRPQKNPFRLPPQYTTKNRKGDSPFSPSGYRSAVFLIPLPVDSSKIVLPRNIDPDAEIVFVTMSREFAVEAFSLRAVHYLMKPVEAGQLREVACRLRQKQKRKYLHFKSGRQEMRVDLSILCYLQSRHNKTDLITRNGMLYASSPLSALTPELDERFLTISRGLVVNMDYIKDMQTSFCLLEDGRKVLLSRGMRGEIVRRYQDYVFNQIEEKGAGK